MKPRVTVFGIAIDPLTMEEAVATIGQWANTKNGCRFVVTPNVDNVVTLHENSGFRAAYENASLVLVDGNPVRWAAKLLGHSLPEVVPGSDLVPALFDAAKEWGSLRVFLLGAGPGVAARAAVRVRERWPWVEVCGTYSPPQGFEYDKEECERMLRMISIAGPQVLILGLGAPKQELWVYHHGERIAAHVALCVGATIDFLAGEKKRAPLWMRKLCLEWLYRMLSEPRRLTRRYMHDAGIFPRLVIAELWKKEQSGP